MVPEETENENEKFIICRKIPEKLENWRISLQDKANNNKDHDNRKARPRTETNLKGRIQSAIRPARKITNILETF